jgi:cytochrome d ubiquinol oxidase subunit II
VGGAFLLATVAVAVDKNDKDAFPPILPAVLGIIALALAAGFVLRRKQGWAFAMTALGILLTIATLFTSLYPRVLVSAPDFGNSLTVESASSSHYALAVMTVAALLLTPVVLLYQGWTYYVFRGRLGGEEIEAPVDLVARETGS